MTVIVICFFFQAEDGIRDIGVTGVQTCALPICRRVTALERLPARGVDPLAPDVVPVRLRARDRHRAPFRRESGRFYGGPRTGERRGGEESRSLWSACL